MPRACCVPGCKANYKTFEVSAFRFPSDERRQLQWVKAIHREDFTPSSTSVVCARHFEEHVIITEDSITRPDGTVITAKRGTPALAKDAFPTIFPNQPKYLSKEAPPARTNPQERKDKMLARDEVQFQVWMENDMINSFEEFGDKFVVSDVDKISYCIQVIREVLETKSEMESESEIDRNSECGVLWFCGEQLNMFCKEKMRYSYKGIHLRQQECNPIRNDSSTDPSLKFLSNFGLWLKSWEELEMPQQGRTLAMPVNGGKYGDPFIFSKQDLYSSTTSKHGQTETSAFDHRLLNQWDAAMSAGVFKYSLEGVETKVLPGKYHIVIQMNSNRNVLRRTPQAIVDVQQPFDPNKFNFTKVKKEEHLLQLLYKPDLTKKIEHGEERRLETGVGSVLINNAPICSSHSLLMPSLSQCLSQVMTGDGLSLALHVLLLSCSPDLRVAYNSLGGYASVNHFHFHVYYLPFKLYIETAGCVQLAGPCYTFEDYYAPGFVFQLENGDIEQLSRRVMLLVNMFVKEKIAHNLYITRGKCLDGKETGEEYKTLRVFIWVRKFISGIKDIKGICAASLELATHVPVFSQDDWKSVCEEDVAWTAHSACQKYYDAMKPKVISLFSSVDSTGGLRKEI
ncbi:hypothetical protein Pcinc_028365 [Petrolisthes cinctipes]|uniref:THAP-type domain-containing protein n=1 Tax=Petrolisthes cinctipes TaxID=88211 RepID=A0AAE1F368_PETCI|nr:hypothetical protein Pcinc_028365 [Petrolisthes cinctipes]